MKTFNDGLEAAALWHEREAAACEKLYRDATQYVPAREDLGSAMSRHRKFAARLREMKEGT